MTHRFLYTLLATCIILTTSIVTVNADDDPGWILKEKLHTYIKERYPEEENFRYELAWIAEVERKNRRAAIVWPIVIGKENQILDDDVVAFIYQKVDGDWQLIEEESNKRMNLSRDTKSDLITLLKGVNFTVYRNEGVSTDELEKLLLEESYNFQTQIEEGNVVNAARIFENIARAFTFGYATFDDDLPELMIKKLFSSSAGIKLGNYNKNANKAKTKITLTHSNGTKKYPVKLVKVNDGWAIDEIKGADD